MFLPRRHSHQGEDRGAHSDDGKKGKKKEGRSNSSDRTSSRKGSADISRSRSANTSPTRETRRNVSHLSTVTEVYCEHDIIIIVNVYLQASTCMCMLH